MIQYFLKQEVNGAVYSIDRLSLFWGHIPSKLFNQIKHEMLTTDYTKAYFPEAFTAHRFGNPVEVVQYRGVHYEFWTDKDKKYGAFNRVRLDFNPNKVKDDSRLVKMISLLSCFGWAVRRVDYAIDIPVPLSSVYIVSRKTESFFRGTRYYGTRHNTGYLRVYDKALEQGIKDEPLTRLEWEQHGNIDLDFAFDRFMVGDFSRSADTYLGRLVQFVSPEYFNSFCQTADYKTRQKFFDSFERCCVNENTFYNLLQDTFAAYGLDIRWRVVNEKVLTAKQLADDDARNAEMEEFKERFPFAYQWLFQTGFDPVEE